MSESEEAKKAREKRFNQVFELLDCIAKHDWSTHVLLFEGIEAAIEKGESPECIQTLVKIHDKHVEITMQTLSYLIPDRQCLAQIQELWRAVGWMNLTEEHLEEKYAAKPLATEIRSFVNDIDGMLQARRRLRRELETLLFKSMLAEAAQTDGTDISSNL
jgi:hypothetical protein